MENTRPDSSSCPNTNFPQEFAPKAKPGFCLNPNFARGSCPNQKFPRDFVPKAKTGSSPAPGAENPLSGFPLFKIFETLLGPIFYDFKEFITILVNQFKEESRIGTTELVTKLFTNFTPYIFIITFGVIGFLYILNVRTKSKKQKGELSVGETVKMKHKNYLKILFLYGLSHLVFLSFYLFRCYNYDLDSARFVNYNMYCVIGWLFFYSTTRILFSGSTLSIEDIRNSDFNYMFKLLPVAILIYLSALGGFTYMSWLGSLLPLTGFIIASAFIQILMLVYFFLRYRVKKF